MNPSVNVSVDLTGWLAELQRDLDAALADMMQVLRASDENTYTPSHRIGVMDVVMSNPDGYADTAPGRATRACFLACIGKFVGYMDKLIASQRLKREGIGITRDLGSEEDLKVYCDEYMKDMIAKVARDQSLTNPKKLDCFQGMGDHLRETAVAYFQLRRVLEHHQDTPSQELTLPISRMAVFAGDREMTEIPFIVRGGEVAQLRMLREYRKFPTNQKIILSVEDVNAIHMTMRMILAPELFRVHLESFENPVTPR